MNNTNRPKRKVGAGFFWVVQLLASILVILALYTTGLLPLSWILYAASALSLLLVFTGYLSFKFYKNGFVKFIDILLSLFLLVVSVALPYYNSKILRLFNSLVGNTTRINLYVMTEDYKAAHPDYFFDTFSSDNLQDYANASFLTSLSSDTDNQVYALDKVREEIGDGFSISDQENLMAAVEALYRGDGDVLVMSQKFESFVSDNEAFANFRADTKIIASYEREVESNIRKGDQSLTKEPFAVFVCGNDEEGDLSTEGRTDVNIVLVVNPNTGQMIQINIPRDTYIPNPAYGNVYDKLTHLGVNGIENSLQGLSNYLEVNINNYILINFTTYRQVIDSLGGIDVENPYGFGFWDNPDIWFEEGALHLNGEDALLYVRERKTLPDGDFGRVMHQQLVMKSIIKKMTSREIIYRFDDVLDGLNGKFLTNMSGEGIYGLTQKQLRDGTDWDTISYRIIGYTDMASCAISPYELLSVVVPYEEQVAIIKEEIQKLLRGETITQLELTYE